MSYDVFISHGSEDRAVAEAACAAIERSGHVCWIAPRDIVPGQDDDEAALDGIRASKVFLLILSSHSADSEEARRGAERAANAGLALIPLRIEDVAPAAGLEPLLRPAQWLDALTPPLGPHLDYLTAIVGRLLDGGDGAPLRPLTAPPRPMPALPRRTPAWLPIAMAGLAGLAAIAAAAALRASQ